MMNRVFLAGMVGLLLIVTACDNPANAPAEAQAQPEPIERPAPDTPDMPDAPEQEPPQPPANEPDETGEPTMPEPTTTTPAIEMQPLPIYPAYYTDENGGIWGIPEDLQGMKHRVKIEPEATPPAATVKDFFTSGAYIYLTIERTDPATEEDGEPVVTTVNFRQSVGGAAIEVVETIPVKPTAARITATIHDFEILDTGTASELWNQQPEFVTDITPNGHGPIVRDEITAAIRLDHGLLFASDVGLEFLPTKKMSTNTISGVGRLWK